MPSQKQESEGLEGVRTLRDKKKRRVAAHSWQPVVFQALPCQKIEGTAAPLVEELTRNSKLAPTSGCHYAVGSFEFH